MDRCPTKDAHCPGAGRTGIVLVRRPRVPDVPPRRDGSRPVCVTPVARRSNPHTLVNILLVDDHALFRHGLRLLLSDLGDGHAFLEADRVEAALAMAATGTPVDLILLDLNLPGSAGIATLDVVKTAFPQATVVVLSSEENPALIRDTIERGAAGFVPKASTPPVLISALRLVLSGGIYLPLTALRDLDRADGERSQQLRDTRRDVAANLSDRQRQVLMLLVLGKPNKVIAREIGISESTVKLHLSAAFRALGVQNRTEAVYVAAQLGLTADDPGSRPR